MYGDVEVMKNDFEDGIIPIAPHVEYRRVALDLANGKTSELLSAADYFMAHDAVQNHNHTVTEIQEIVDNWEMLGAELRGVFTDPKELMDMHMVAHWRNIAIVQAWDNSPVVLVL
jgi:hypothetical protein